MRVVHAPHRSRSVVLMRPIWRVVSILGVFAIASIAWLILGGVMSYRTTSLRSKLHGDVAGLWGSPHRQQAPKLSFQWTTETNVRRIEKTNGVERVVDERKPEVHTKDVSPTATDVDVALALDQRLRGLVWHSLYDVRFAGGWRYEHRDTESGWLTIGFEFPDPQGLFDGFHFVVDGQDRAAVLRPESGRVSTQLWVKPGQIVSLAVAYQSRGVDEWRYVPAQGVTNLENFRVSMTTDFAAIDFPSFTMSPSAKEQTTDGWKLEWKFAQVVTGHQVGMTMPQRLQPGELAAAMSFSAPISLLFFFTILFVLGTLRKIDFHPVHYVFLAAAFFAFHLLFGYSVDLIHVVPAFVLSSFVSLALVVSYLRLVVSNRFAFVEAAAAQLVYLIGFSLAHFLGGYTGLTVTVLSIGTLFVLMQLTGRIKWGEPTPLPSAA